MTEFAQGSMDGALATLTSMAREIDRRMADRSSTMGDVLAEVDAVLMIALRMSEELEARFPAWRKVSELETAHEVYTDSPRYGGWQLIAMIAKLRMLANAPDLLQQSLRDFANRLEYEALGGGLTDDKRKMLYEYFKRHPKEWRKLRLRASAERRKGAAHPRRRGPRSLR